VKHLNSKLYYQQLNFEILVLLGKGRIVIICEIILHLLVIEQINRRCMVQVLK